MKAKATLQGWSMRPGPNRFAFNKALNEAKQFPDRGPGVLWCRNRRHRPHLAVRVRCAGLASEALVETKMSAGGALSVSIQNNTLLAGEHCFLTNLSPYANASPTRGVPGLILGLRTSTQKESSFENVALGSLQCQRSVPSSNVAYCACMKRTRTVGRRCYRASIPSVSFQPQISSLV
jgi:hypothetical protein